MNKRKLWIFLFVCYCVCMLNLLFRRPGYDPALPYLQQLKYNLVPFETIILFLRALAHSGGGMRTHALINLAGNVVMFLPLGYLLGAIWPSQRKWSRIFRTTLAIMLAVELTQMLTLVGSFDTDDLILNILGSLAGYGLFRLLQQNTKNTGPR